MGYCITQMDSDFHIDVDKKHHALEAIKELMTKVDDLGGGGRSKGKEIVERWFSWVNTDRVMESTTLEEALLGWRWETLKDKDDNVVGIYFTGEKYGDDMYLWDAIAPFVTDGSFICMKGEDGELFEWIFEEGRCFEKRK